MILDSHGVPLRRAIGFILRYEPVRVPQKLIGALCVVGVEAPLGGEEEEEDAAPDKSMRRAA